MEDTVYIVDAIVPEGKGKIIKQEEWVAFSYRNDEHNNLIFEDEHGNLVYQYHSYNWKGVYPKTEVTPESGIYCPASTDHKCYRNDCVGSVCGLIGS